ncbi:unnamed protein product [Schistosoma curassoni]|uniref:Chromatin modification-related protein eaf-1 n=1 Tax=Schistosoma curassoni TaxID=6186 RepID=A0A183KWH2_9TREM|nr:unnamed protein product [Schistosoma curassoni]
MEDEAKTDVQTLKSLLNNNEESDSDVKEQGSPFDVSSNPVGDLQSPFSSRSQPPAESEEISNPETAVKQLTTDNSQNILPNTPASLTRFEQLTHIVIKYDFIEFDATSHSFSATCLICIWFCECWNCRIRTGAQQPTHLLSLQEFHELFASLSDEEQRTETVRKYWLVSYNSESESESEQNVLESKLPTSNISGILPGDVPDDVKHDYTSQNSPSNENNKIVTESGKFQTVQEKYYEKQSYSSSIHQKSSKRHKNEKETDTAVTISRSHSKHSHKRKTNPRHSHRSRKRDFRDSSTASSESSSSNHGNQKVGLSRFSRSSEDHSDNVRSPKPYFTKSSHSKHSHHKSHH